MFLLHYISMVCFLLTVGSILTVYEVMKAVVRQMLVRILTVNKDTLQKEVSVIIMSKERVLETWVTLLYWEWSILNLKWV